MSSNITSAWLAEPANSANVGAGNEALQDIKDTFRVRIAREHQLLTTEASPQTVHGVHKAGSAVSFAQSSAPTLRPDGVTTLNASDHGRLWLDTDTNKMYIWIWATSSGSWIEVSPAHGLVVLTSGSSWTSTHTGPVKVTCVGGGGGGGGFAASSNWGTAGGGGAGAVASRVYDVVLGTSYTYAIGSAGTAGSAGLNAGGAGGNTTFTDGVTLMTAGGGAGGAGADSTTSQGQAAAGGSATNGTLNVSGLPGGHLLGAVGISGLTCQTGKGGDGPYGQGGMPGRLTYYREATGYGAGGRGAFSNTNTAGGAGTAGCIIIEW